MNTPTEDLNRIEKTLLSQRKAPYYNWVRQLIILSSSGLTLLVALQKNYVPQNPMGLWLLQLCWCFLAISIVFGLLVLFGESQTLLGAVKYLRKKRQNQGDTETQKHISRQIGYTGNIVFSIAFYIAEFNEEVQHMS